MAKEHQKIPKSENKSFPKPLAKVKCSLPFQSFDGNLPEAMHPNDQTNILNKWSKVDLDIKVSNP